MPELPAHEAEAWVARLCAGLAALRLNKHFPPWRAVAAHLSATAVLPPGEALSICENTGWPHRSAWLRVRADHGLAPQLLPRLAHLEAKGDAPSMQKGEYLRAMAAAVPLQDRPLRAALVRREQGVALYEVVLDRLDLALPAFVRWTVRLVERDTGGQRFSVGELETRASAQFVGRMRLLATQPAAAALAALQAESGVEVEELVRGEIGPIVGLDADTPPDHLTAVLSRVSTTLKRTSVDDPLAEAVLAPGATLHFGLSRHRKWAVPVGAVAARRAWLDGRGSRNLVYTYVS